MILFDFHVEPLDTKLLKETETKRAPTPTSTSTYVIELLSHSQDLPVRPLTVEVVLHETFLKEEKKNAKTHTSGRPDKTQYAKL